MARPVDISDEAIIDVAQVLFLEKGIAATEMKDIAQRAKIGRSSLYRHFESNSCAGAACDRGRNRGAGTERGVGTLCLQVDGKPRLGALSG